MDCLLNIVRDPEQRDAVRTWVWTDRVIWFVIGVLTTTVSSCTVLMIYG
jgi:hypothetical protein